MSRKRRKGARRTVVLRDRQLVEGIAQARAVLRSFGVSTAGLSDADILKGIGHLLAMSAAASPVEAFAEAALAGDRVALAIVKAYRTGGISPGPVH